MLEAMQPPGNTGRLAIDNGVIGEVANHVYKVQAGIIHEERAEMEPVLQDLCDKLRTATSNELTDGNEVPGIRRAVGFAAAHQIVRRSAGGRLGIDIQLRADAALNYAKAARRDPPVLSGDFETIFGGGTGDWADLRRFVAGELHPGQSGGQGCTNPESRFSARLMLVLAGSVGLSTGGFIYLRTPPPVQQTAARRRHVRATGRPY